MKHYGNPNNDVKRKYSQPGQSPWRVGPQRSCRSQWIESPYGHRAEYLHIVDYVRSRFSEPRRRELLQFIEERPRRCPFLVERHGCTIYEVRPLICRTYAVMDHRTIAAAAALTMPDAPAISSGPWPTTVSPPSWPWPAGPGLRGSYTASISTCSSAEPLAWS